ncbi:MAG TPA: hypothetical protein VK034_14035 [Enhygromyxa sp.]|nr:hypothetical protein [Enhygromyxa sp.]
MLVLALLILVLAAITAPWTLIPGDNADGAGMRAHLHAIFESGELLYDDEYAALGMSPLFAFVTDEGLISNHWPIGASFVQAPGWLLGRAAGSQLVGAGVSERAATWDIPLLGLRSWALVVLVGIAILVLRCLRPRVGRQTATLAVGALLLGTPLVYYAAEAPERPHLWGFAAVAVLTSRWCAAIERPPDRARLRDALELSVYAGLATAIRPQLAMLALLVVHERWLATRELELGPRLARLARDGLACASMFAIWPAMVVRMQEWMYGGLVDYQGEVSQQLRAFLLSTHHGALVWCPVLVVGLLGISIGAARRESGALLIVALIAAQVWLDAGTREIQPYAVLGTRTWTGGTSFGPRKLLDAMPLLLPGVIWLHRWLAEQDSDARRKWQRRLATATVLAVIPTSLLSIAAWLDPRVCSNVLDGERLLIAMSLPFDLDAWTTMLRIRAVPMRVSLAVAALVGVPLSLALVVGTLERWSLVRARWAWPLALGYGLIANAWMLHLQQRTEAIVEQDPERIEQARARLNPWHEALVEEIPRHQALLQARLGPGV